MNRSFDASGGKKRFPAANMHYISHNAVIPPDLYNIPG